MDKTVLHVDGMACEHCVKAVTKALNALPGIGSVLVDLSGKTVTVEHDPANVGIVQMKVAIEEQGYEVVG